MTLIKKYWREASIALIVLVIATGAVWKLNNPSSAIPTPAPPAIATVTPNVAVPPVIYIRSDQFLGAQASIRRGGPISEAYLMEHIQARWAKNLIVLWDDAYSTCGIESVSTHSWPDDNTIRIKAARNGWAGHRGVWTVKFSQVHYDPALTEITYGKTKISQEIPTELSGHAYLFDLQDYEETATFEQIDTVTLEQHRETTMTHSTEMNYTASSETTIGGSYAGVGLEEKLTLTFGADFKDEESQAEGESKSQTSEHKFDVDLPPLQATLVLLDSIEVHSSTPFDVNGVGDWKVQVHIPDAACYGSVSGTNDPHYLDWYQHGAAWTIDRDNLDWCHAIPYGHKGYVERGEGNFSLIAVGGCDLEFGADGSAIEEVAEVFSGTHVRWPGYAKYGYVRGFIHYNRPAHVIEAWEAFQDPARRRVQLSGTQRRVYENTIKEAITNVTGEDLDKIAEQHGAERPPIGQVAINTAIGQ